MRKIALNKGGVRQNITCHGNLVHHFYGKYASRGGAERGIYRDAPKEPGNGKVGQRTSVKVIERSYD